MFIPTVQNIRNVLLYVAKNAASGAFGLIFLYTSELFPTSVRSSGIGACSLMARVGALATPYMADLADLAGDRVPYYILGGFAGEILKFLMSSCNGYRKVNLSYLNTLDFAYKILAITHYFFRCVNWPTNSLFDTH